ncbi:MAG TPA: hypothetical protein VGJ14_16685 [Sporichthyaceae bacterium]
MAFLIGGCLGVNNSVLLAEQTRYITTGGIGGIFLLGLGATLWISADLRDEWRKLDRIERTLSVGVVARPNEPSAGADVRVAQSGAHQSVKPHQAPADSNGLAPVAYSREHA